jgi:RNA polymerase sigma-70 factor (ECF subfamily)
MDAQTSFDFQLVRLRQPLYYFALSLTKNDADAEDLLQETLLKALLYKSKYIDNTNLKGWLCTIMKNIFINEYRRKSRNQTVSDESPEGKGLSKLESTKGSYPDTMYQVQEITTAVDRLGEEYKMPLNLYFEGYKYKEIADIMHLPLGTIKSRIFLARKQLQGPLGELRPRNMLHTEEC